MRGSFARERELCEGESVVARGAVGEGKRFCSSKMRSKFQDWRGFVVSFDFERLEAKQKLFEKFRAETGFLTRPVPNIFKKKTHFSGIGSDLRSYDPTPKI